LNLLEDSNFRTTCGPADIPAAFIVDPGKAKHARLFEAAAVSLVSVSEYRVLSV
jgi:hypothetical protein